ncbi:hypothetical protein KR093_004178 [Drosophila rubida]|uniref:Protein TsetseEP domain-containing protein n=1 Tax=Drosophila rubida TaxID=30044 RepID=A0AAD4JZ15_9MUSC|nr:hypothetical protein KR093_004178 [Drosophila rubida]
MCSINAVLLLVACLLGCAWATPHPTWGESKLLQAMRSTSEQQLANPSRSLECFQYYSEVFDQLLKKYEAEYAACQNTSKQQTAVLDSKYSQIVDSLNSSSVTTCQRLIDCNAQVDSLHSLSCYSNAGENVRGMYNISSKASAYYGDLEQLIQQIQFTEDQCINASKRSYELNTDQAYINLQQCLMSTDPLPTLAPTTNTTPTPTTELPNSSSASTTASTASNTETSNTPTTVESTTAASTRRTSRPLRTTTSSFVTTNAATSTTTNSFSSELKKLLHSLSH